MKSGTGTALVAEVRILLLILFKEPTIKVQKEVKDQKDKKAVQVITKNEKTKKPL